MGEQMTFIFASDSGTSVRQATLPVWSLWAVGAVLAICLCLAGYATNDYLSIRRTYADARYQERNIAVQKQTIRSQKEELQEFARKINALKNKLIELATFERKIEIIANIDPSADNEVNSFPVSAPPDDLDPGWLLEEQQHGVLLREMHEQMNHLRRRTQTKIGHFDKLFQKLKDQRNLLASTPAIRPVEAGWVTSGFGNRTSPFTGEREFHSGLDIAAHSGTPVISPAAGVVTFSASKRLSGNVMVIDHGHGMTTTYSHLKRFLKKKGERVKRGEMIGEVGNTGRSTGPHLHYEVRLNGTSVNPDNYILN